MVLIFLKGSWLSGALLWVAVPISEWPRATTHMVTATSRLQVIPTNSSTKPCFCVKHRNSELSPVQQGCGTMWAWQSSCPKTQHPVIASGCDVLFATINKMGRKFPTQVEIKAQGRLVGCRWEDPVPAHVPGAHDLQLQIPTWEGRGKGGPGSCAASTEELCSSARSLSNVAWICQQKSSALVQRTFWSKVVQIPAMKWRNPKDTKQMMNQITYL